MKLRRFSETSVWNFDADILTTITSLKPTLGTKHMNNTRSFLLVTFLHFSTTQFVSISLVVGLDHWLAQIFHSPIKKFQLLRCGCALFLRLHGFNCLGYCLINKTVQLWLQSLGVRLCMHESGFEIIVLLVRWNLF